MRHIVRAEITIRGEVQRAGYHYLVQDKAREFEIRGYVQNMPDGAVQIVAEAVEEHI